LKPTGIESPLAISRCVWLSVVRAPIAVQETRSAMYCGVIGSSSSVPAASPSPAMSMQELPRQAEAELHVVGAVQMRIVDEPLPPDGGARLLEVDAHHDEDLGLDARRERGRRRA
jgi:hypothetical protein